jgi:hypothetical protein
MSNKIDDIHDKTHTISIVVVGSFIGTGLGLMFPILMGIFK